MKNKNDEEYSPILRNLKKVTVRTPNEKDRWLELVIILEENIWDPSSGKSWSDYLTEEKNMLKELKKLEIIK